MSPIVEHDLPHSELLGAAAVNSFAGIPAEQGWTATALDPQNLPVLDGRAITATVEGLGRVLIIARRGLAGAIEADLPSVGFVGALSDAARSLLFGLGLADGGALGHVEEIDGAIGMAMIDPHQLAAVAIADGDAPRATVVVGRDTAGERSPRSPRSPSGPAPTVQAHDFAPLHGTNGATGATGTGPSTDAGARSVGILSDVQLGVTVELGRTRLSVREILALTLGSVIELDRPAGAPVDLFVNGTLIARGEVVVIDEEFGIRVSEVIGYAPGSATN